MNDLQQVYIGWSAIGNLLPILQNLHAKHIFLVRGKRSYTLCGAEKIMQHCVEQLHCQVTQYFDFQENPKMEEVHVGVALFQKAQPDVVIAVGGGSVMDMAKLIRFYASSNTPLIAIPTTAGTGAEATHFAVVYVDGVKQSIEHERILPDIAIVYPELLYSNPPYLTACAGFDALAQAIEAYWSVNATEESDSFAKTAIQLLWPNLAMLITNPCPGAYMRVAEGAYRAGRAINITKTTAPHALSYYLTTNYGIPHGHAVAMTFPFIMAYNYPKDPSLLCEKLNFEAYKTKMDSLHKLLGIASPEIAEQTMKDYITALGLNLQFPEGCTMDILFRHVNQDRLKNNPMKLIL